LGRGPADAPQALCVRPAIPSPTLPFSKGGSRAADDLGFTLIANRVSLSRRAGEDRGFRGGDRVRRGNMHPHPFEPQAGERTPRGAPTDCFRTHPCPLIRSNLTDDMSDMHFVTTRVYLSGRSRRRGLLHAAETCYGMGRVAVDGRHRQHDRRIVAEAESARTLQEASNLNGMGGGQDCHEGRRRLAPNHKA
jgi:hypothetical protein